MKNRTLTVLVTLCLASAIASPFGEDESTPAATASPMRVQYLEIVTPDVEATCKSLAALHGVTFSDPVPVLGFARTAERPDGALLGVRAPMRETEDPVVRPYMLVDDIEAAVKTAVEHGGEVAMLPMEIPGGRGTFAIYLQGGIQHGLWQL